MVSESAAPAAPEPEKAPAARVRGRNRRFATRWSRRLLFLVIAVFAGLFVTLFTVDIGRLFDLKKLAEGQATKFMGRPMHIGRLSAYLTPGNFALDDVVIEGLTPDAKPFLTAKRIFVHVPLWRLAIKQVDVEVRMTDWSMCVEQWPDGHHSFPKLSLPGRSTKGPSTWKTTLDAVYADRGEFIYEDHGTPWSVDARGLSVDLVHAPELVRTLGSQYVGRARFSGGTVQIQDFLPMRASLGASFVIDKSLVRLHRIDLVTDGAVSRVTGVVDLGHWPEQTYQVDSTLDFPRMREIFFGRESWRLAGTGRFQGSFHLYHGGRELKGSFAGTNAALNELAFPNLRGSLDWLPQSFAVPNATSDLLGGRTSFDYSLNGFGTPGGADATFDAKYVGVDGAALAKYAGIQHLDLTGSVDGRAAMHWKNGHFHDTYRAEGATEVLPPAGRRVAEPELPEPAIIVLPDPLFNDHKPLGQLPVGAEIAYTATRDGFEFAPSWVATPSTYVAFHGHVGPTGGELNLPARVVSKDWQASDRLLSAILAERHAPTRVIDVGGRGTFDGVMTESFRDFHAAGTFAGESIWAFGVRWPKVSGGVVIADNFVTVTGGEIRGSDPLAHIHVDGKFAIGSNTAGDDLTGKFAVTHWPLTDFKVAFGQTTWPIEGIGSATLDLHGPYRALVGTGTLRIDQGSAWQEPFDAATTGMTFEGRDLLLNSIEMTKGAGRMHGTALIKWDNTYSFDATGEHVAVEALHNFKVPAAPLSGQLDFRVSGAGSFDTPTYTFEGHVADLYAGDEGVGDVAGTLHVHGTDLTLSDLNVEGRVQAAGQGRISLVKPYDAELTLTATDASIDPFLKFVMKEPPQLFRLAVSGSARVAGPLGDPSRLVVDTRLTQASLQIFDYALQNDGLVHLSYGGDTVSIDTLDLRGADTELKIRGSVARGSRTLDLRADGDANLAMLQAFKGFGDLSLGGSANISARLVGDFDHPRFTGQADLHDGRLRFPRIRSLEALNGRITFENGNLDFSELKGRMGGGDVTFGGVLRFDGFHPVEYQLTAVGHNVQVPYPAGFETTANATLWMRGAIASPTLGGEIKVTGVRYTRPLSTDAGLLGLAAAGGGAAADQTAAAAGDQTGLSVNYDIHVSAPSMEFFQSKEIKLYGSASDITVRGTVDSPIIFGKIELDRGEAFFNGNRFRLTSGSIDFANPQRTEPYFDVQASTQVHVQQQTYNITGHLTGRGTDITCHGGPDCDVSVPRFSVDLHSDPALSTIDIYTLLLGGSTDPGSTERRQLDSPQTAQKLLIETMGTQLFTAPIASRVGSLVGNFIPLDTIQFVPLLGLDPTVGTGTTTSARVTLGKAVNDRVYLTYSRDVANAQELYLLEYQQNDRVSWMLSRNEDHTFALEFRIRHIF